MLVTDARRSFFLRVTQCQATRSNSDCRHILSSSSSGLWSLGSSTTGERHAGITTGSLASTPQPGNGCHALNCTAFGGGRRIGARSLCCFENNSAMLFGKTLRDAAQYTHRLSQSGVNGGLIPSVGDFTQCWWITGIPSAARVDSANPH